MWLASCGHGENCLDPESADKLAGLLGLGPDVQGGADRTAASRAGAWTSPIPTDPLIYRFYEIMQVYGLPLKDVIQEMFGDGIMSAIDFTMRVEKEEDPKGDRVRLTMSGKFLPYKAW